MTTGKVKRPILRWHGGKWRLAPWIVSHFPPHLTYVEPFGGVASVLLQKPRSYSEVYNDLDKDVVGLFQILRSESCALEIERLLRLTPYAREEFLVAYNRSEDPLENARRVVVRSAMGYSSTSRMAHRTGFRANITRPYTTPAHDWANYPDNLQSFVSRLQGVVIESRPALEIMDQYDAPSTLFYLDPPYMFSTRGSVRCKAEGSRCYAHEMTDADHEQLLSACRSTQGMVVLSGYRNPLYDRVLSDWVRLDKKAHADGAKPRTESLWMNPAASACQQQTLEMEDSA